MQKYKFCANIRIDGDEFISGFLGLTWFPSAQAERKQADYEKGVDMQLDVLLKSFAGWSIINEIYKQSKKTLTIRPFHPPDKPKDESDRCNAYASPTDVEDATGKGATVNDTYGNPIKKYKPGTGTGSDAILQYSSDTFRSGSACASGPGATPDEILLHEMTHGLRQMAGMSDKLKVKENLNMHNFEEFVAIVISNIYRSERKIPQLRSDHTGFVALTGPTTDPDVFAKTFRDHLSLLVFQQTALCSNLARVKCDFNPIASYLHSTRFKDAGDFVMPDLSERTA
jgi:hypothetical protein